MSAQNNKQIAAKWFDAFNEHDLKKTIILV